MYVIDILFVLSFPDSFRVLHAIGIITDAIMARTKIAQRTRARKQARKVFIMRREEAHKTNVTVVDGSKTETNAAQTQLATASRSSTTVTACSNIVDDESIRIVHNQESLASSNPRTLSNTGKKLLVASLSSDGAKRDGVSNAGKALLLASFSSDGVKLDEDWELIRIAEEVFYATPHDVFFTQAMMSDLLRNVRGLLVSDICQRENLAKLPVWRKKKLTRSIKKAICSLVGVNEFAELFKECAFGSDDAASDISFLDFVTKYVRIYARYTDGTREVLVHSNKRHKLRSKSEIMSRYCRHPGCTKRAVFDDRKQQIDSSTQQHNCVKAPLDSEGEMPAASAAWGWSDVATVGLACVAAPFVMAAAPAIAAATVATAGAVATTAATVATGAAATAGAVATTAATVATGAAATAGAVATTAATGAGVVNAAVATGVNAAIPAIVTLKAVKHVLVKEDPEIKCYLAVRGMGKSLAYSALRAGLEYKCGSDGASRQKTLRDKSTTRNSSRSSATVSSAPAAAVGNKRDRLGPPSKNLRGWWNGDYEPTYKGPSPTKSTGQRFKKFLDDYTRDDLRRY